MSSSKENKTPVIDGFKDAMRRLAATVTIITTSDANGHKYGMTATAVNSVSMDPPSLLICVNTSTSIHAPLLERGRFCVNVLTTEHEELVSAFSGRLHGEDRFTVGNWQEDETAIPFLKGAQCNVFCDIESVTPFGTHSVIIGRVSDVATEEGITPLLFADGKLRATQSLERGYVRIAANLSTITQFLPHDLKEFTNRYPLVEINLDEKVSTDVVESVLENSKDVGFIVGECKSKDLDIFPYRTDRLVVAVPSEHELVGKKSVKFSETLKYDYIGLHSGSQINLKAQSCAGDLGIPWRCKMQVKTYDALCAMVEEGIGIGILPENIAKIFAKALKVEFVELDEDWANRKHSIVVRDYNALQISARRFVDGLRTSVIE